MGKRKGKGRGTHQQEKEIDCRAEGEEENINASGEEEENISDDGGKEDGDENEGGDDNVNGNGGKNGGRKTVIFKVLMYCDGCVSDVRKSVIGFQGVEKVTVDVDSSRLTVIGRVDPIRIRDRVERKTGKRVELIMPANPKKKPQPQPQQDKKPKEPPVSTMALRMDLHCEGCTLRIRKAISKFKGVASVAVEFEKNLVTVGGTMEVKKLVEHLKEKLRRPVEIFSPKKEGGKKAAANNALSEKGGKKENSAANNEVNYYYGEYGYGYTIRMLQAPQLFSDENPNSCSIM